MERTKEKPISLTREQYKRVRNLDHNMMNEYLIGIYLQGYEKGAATAGLDVEKALEEIGNIKGIGKTKLEEIKAVLTAERRSSYK